jgi:alginate O-acetyltransferase complex protein AlgI
MLFQTPEFLALFLLTLLAFYGLRARFRLATLAAASTFFYAASGLGYLAVFMATIVVSYAISLRLKQDGPRWPLYAAVCVMLGSLAYFRYGGFIYDNLDPVYGLNRLISREYGYFHHTATWDFLLSFQIVAYFNDVHRGRVLPASSFLQ